jgi:integrase
MAVYRHRDKWKYDFLKHGRRHRKGGFESKKEAVEAEAKARANLKRTNTDFLRLCESRLEELAAKRTSKHFKENKALIEKLILRWGNQKEVTREDVEKYLNEISRESKQKANKHLRLTRALFSHGIEREWFDYNPAGKIKRYPVTPKARYVPPEADVLKVLTLANPEDRDYLLTVAHTLGRITAVNNIRKEDIHLSEGYISLFTRKARNSDLKEIKVPINKVLEEILIRRIKTAQGFLFVNPDTGKPYGYRSKFLKTLCKRAKVKIFSYHSLRHFGASLLSKLGVGTTEIQQLLGHTRVSTTDLYLKSLGHGTKEAIKKLEIINPGYGRIEGTGQGKNETSPQSPPQKIRGKRKTQ